MHLALAAALRLRSAVSMQIAALHPDLHVTRSLAAPVPSRSPLDTALPSPTERRFETRVLLCMRIEMHIERGWRKQMLW